MPYATGRFLTVATISALTVVLLSPVHAEQPASVHPKARNNTWMLVAGQPGTVRDNPALSPENLAHDHPVASGLRDGTGAASRFLHPGDIAVDSRGNLFVLDQNDTVVRKITPAGVVSTIAFLPKTTSEEWYNGRNHIAIAHDGDIFVSLANQDVILDISPAGTESIYAGRMNTAGDRNGPRARALFSAPQGLVFDKTGNLYVADSANNAIRKITSAGWVTTLTGGARGLRDGPLAFARFETPDSLAIDRSGNIYVAEYVSVDDEGRAEASCAIREIGVNGKVVTVGEDAYGPIRRHRVAPKYELESALLIDTEHEAAIAVDSQDILYFSTGLDGMAEIDLSDPYSERMERPLRVDRGPGLPMPVSVVGMAVDSHGTLYISDEGTSTIFKASPPWGSWW